jgi:hypothetical protein
MTCISALETHSALGLEPTGSSGIPIPAFCAEAKLANDVASAKIAIDKRCFIFSPSENYGQKQNIEKQLNQQINTKQAVIMSRRNSWVSACAFLILGSGCASNNSVSVFHPTAALIDQAKTTGCGDAICASIITTEALARTVFANEKVDQTKVKFICATDSSGAESLGSICPSFRYRYQSTNIKDVRSGVIQGTDPSVTLSYPLLEHVFEIFSMDGSASQKLTAVKGGQTIQLRFK